MLNNVALDVVIGLVFVYLLYSLFGTLIQEIVATNIGLRGYMLQKAIRHMLDDHSGGSTTKLSEAFYNHPLIKYLADGSWPLKNKPSYIDRETFSKVVIDLLKGQNVPIGSLGKQPIQNSLDTAKIAWPPNGAIEPETLSYLRSIWVDAQGDVTKFTANLEQWFDEMMDRTTGWYKKYTQLILLIIGLVIAISFNVDTIKIVRVLQNNPTIRDQVLAQANAFVKAHPDLDKQVGQTEDSLNSINAQIKKDGLIAETKNDAAAITKAQKDSTINAQKIKDITINNKANADLKKLRDTLFSQATTLVGGDINKVNSTLSMGWQYGFLQESKHSKVGFMNVVGWFLTALAISMGAPFWFDLLNKLMQLRSSVAPKDDQTSKSTANNNTKRVV